MVPGVTYDGGLLPILGVALVFGVVNAFMGTVARIVAIPLIILTLGLFWFVINGLMLWLTSSLSSALGLGFHVSGFWAAFWGGLVVSFVSMLLSMLVKEPKRTSSDDRFAFDFGYTESSVYEVFLTTCGSGGTADALASGASWSNPVEVRILSSAPFPRSLPAGCVAR